MCQSSTFYSHNQLAIVSPLYQVHVYIKKMYYSHFWEENLLLQITKKIRLLGCHCLRGLEVG